MKKRALVSFVSAAFLLQALPVSAMGLIEAYEAALQNDPTYRSAVSENQAGQQNKVLGRSNLLPNLSASYTGYKNRADITQPGFLGQEVTTHPEYSSKSASLTLRQPLLNLDGVARYFQGVAQTSYADALLSVRGQELIIRLVGAFAEAKYAEDQVALATIQRDTFAEQRKVNERMFQKGEGTKTDMLETQARYDLAEAQLLEARDNLMNARNALAAIVGGDVSLLDPLADDFKVMPMQPSSFDEWKALALERNAEITAQRYVVDISELEVKKNRAGHAPRVDLVAALNKSKSETVTTLNQDSTVRALGIQVSIPLYSGGSVDASVTQALANLDKAKSDLDAKTNQVLVELRKQYNAAVSGASRIDALVKSVESAKTLVKATEQSVKGGVRINLDVLNAQQQLYTAQRDLALARYNYLLSFLRLRNAAGTLSADDVRTVAGYFVPGGRTNMLSETVMPMRVVAKPEPQVKPVAQKLAPAADAADAAGDEVLKSVQGWAKSWSAKDVKSYLGSYADDFQPAKKQSRMAWSKEREARIAAKGHILVKVEAPKVIVNGDRATVRFRQVYESDSVTDVTVKTLTMARQGGEWKIQQEVAGG